jgi:hypothetical protein
VDLSGNHQSVSPVVANAAKDDKLLVFDAQCLQQDEVKGFAGVFHQEFFLDAKLFYGGPV